jgi:hypothetical protein
LSFDVTSPRNKRFTALNLDAFSISGTRGFESQRTLRRLTGKQRAKRESASGDPADHTDTCLRGIRIHT